MSLYRILEHTPFPGEFIPMPECHLQRIEHAIFTDQKSYYERALVLGDEIYYPRAVAMQIIDARLLEMPRGKYRLENMEDVR